MHLQITLCDVLMDLTLEAIEFYQTYYKHELLFTLTIAMAGWMLIVLGKIFVFEEALSRINWKLICGGVVVAAVIIGYNICKHVYYFALYKLLNLLSFQYKRLQKQLHFILCYQYFSGFLYCLH